MRVIAVTGLKGGVGKTSTAVNLAAISAVTGHRTLLWDLDPQGAATYCLDLKPKLRGGASRLIGGGRGGLAAVARHSTIDGLDVVPADSSVREIDRVLSVSGKPAKPIRKLLAGTKGAADVVILDCPPGLSAVVEAVASVADVLLVPVVPEPLPFRALARFSEFLDETKVASPKIVAPFLSMIDRRKPIHRRIEVEVRSRGGFLGAAIPESSAVARMGEEQVPMVLSAPRSLAAAEYRKLWAEAAERAGLS
ncbi:ParA family protein [Aquihabitans sp. G128]|uniref:ParA family protein n=1 Tax=Aquihabitans sp. G128 TaxID=2849779 RepID=UPI001C241597|nr:ParA family protein [Aquihabitans sp. G128]QXC62891.1 ParA family protein [Aquihabitans sp. G128]